MLGSILILICILNRFQDPQDDQNEKGFYISFDNEQPKRPKPPLRTKRSPKKEKDDTIKEKNDSPDSHEGYNGSPVQQQRRYVEEPIAAKRSYEPQQMAQPVPADRRHLEDVTNQAPMHNMNYNQNINNNMTKENQAIVITESSIDPVSR